MSILCSELYISIYLDRLKHFSSIQLCRTCLCFELLLKVEELGSSVDDGLLQTDELEVQVLADFRRVCFEVICSIKLTGLALVVRWQTVCLVWEVASYNICNGVVVVVTSLWFNTLVNIELIERMRVLTMQRYR